ncbi:MAG: tripartite tricarboxylate transporter TctB family protein [Burkholderiales bacterium]
MTRKVQENVAALAMLLIFTGVVYLCQDFGPRARMIPLPLAIFGIVLTLIQIAWQNLRSTDELQVELISVATPIAAQLPEGEKAPQEARPLWYRELRAYFIVALLIGLVMVVGVIPAVFLFAGGYVLFTRHYGWVKGLTYTALLTLSVYLLFVVALQIEPYHGLMTPLIERLR